MLVAVKGKDTQKWIAFRQWCVASDRTTALYNGFAFDEGKANSLALNANDIADDHEKYARGNRMAAWYYIVDVDDETAVWLAMRFSAMRTRSSVG